MKPRLIRKVTNADGITLWEDAPAVDEIISQQTARTMMTLFRAVTAHGTGAAVAQMNHPLGGKTGHHQRLYRCLVPGLLAFGHLRRLGGLRQPAIARAKRKPAPARPCPSGWRFMKAAIAGKDDEQFPGDTELPPMQQAAATQPAKPASPVPSAPRPHSSSGRSTPITQRPAPSADSHRLRANADSDAD